MNIKNNFTPEEWKSLLKSPMLVSYAVAGAAPSGEKDFIQEMAAVADAIVEGGQQAPKDSLVAAVVADIVANADDEQRGATETISVEDVKGRALEHCRSVAGILQTKAGAEDADAYKRWVVSVARKVASAAKEGGFLGFGGTQVSESETATVNEIMTALGVQT